MAGWGDVSLTSLLTCSFLLPHFHVVELGPFVSFSDGVGRSTQGMPLPVFRKGEVAVSLQVEACCLLTYFMVPAGGRAFNAARCFDQLLQELVQPNEMLGQAELFGWFRTGIGLSALGAFSPAFFPMVSPDTRPQAWCLVSEVVADHRCARNVAQVWTPCLPISCLPFSGRSDKRYLMKEPVSLKHRASSCRWRMPHLRGMVGASRDRVCTPYDCLRLEAISWCA